MDSGAFSGPFYLSVKITCVVVWGANGRVLRQQQTADDGNIHICVPEQNADKGSIVLA